MSDSAGPPPGALPGLAIDLVSPLPPVRSGIADYCLDLLPYLAERCDLRLVRLPGQEVDPAIAAGWPLVEIDRLGQGGRLPLYQMGNNHWHLDVWRQALVRPGVLTLHDLVLHHFLLERTVKHHAFTEYRAELAADHGWIGERAGRPIAWPGGQGRASQFALPAHRTLLGRQLGVLTHSGWAAEMLREELPGLRVAALPMGVPLPPLADAEAGRAFRRRHGLPLEAPLVGAFGFQTPMKRTEALIDAMSDPALAGLHLMVAGEVSPIYGLANFARKVGVEDRVHFLGYLPFEEWEAAITAADLCLNLRYPTAGETSASLLRILAVGKVAIVSDYAQSADLPDEVVVKVPVGDGERQALIAQLHGLLADREHLRALGERARRFVATEHRLDTAAAAIVEACAAWRDLGRPDLPAPVWPAASSLIRHPLPLAVTLHGVGESWPGGERRQIAIELHNRSDADLLAAELDGGFYLQVALLAEGRDLRADHPWLALPKTLEPGASFSFPLTLRRPLGAEVELRVVPHLATPHYFDLPPHLGTLARVAL
jgi:glycosyltransferase involved in cell wall biosynthesis